MKSIKIRILVAILSFIVGISAFCLSRSNDSLVASDISNLDMSNSSSPTTEITAPVKKLLSKVDIRFIRFVQGKSEPEAEFELINNGLENIYYISSSKNSYPFFILKREGKIVQNNQRRCGTGVRVQMLSSKESVIFRLPKSEVTYEQTEDFWRETDKSTQIGFSFEIGNKPFVKTENRQRETFWSEEIRFS